MLRTLRNTAIIAVGAVHSGAPETSHMLQVQSGAK
jgi:hypothetical protein